MYTMGVDCDTAGQITGFTIIGDPQTVNEQRTVLTTALDNMIPLSTDTDMPTRLYAAAAAISMQLVALVEHPGVDRHEHTRDVLSRMRFYLRRRRTATMQDHPGWTEAEAAQHMTGNYAYFAVDWDTLLGPHA